MMVSLPSTVAIDATEVTCIQELTEITNLQQGLMIPFNQGVQWLYYYTYYNN